MQFVKKGKDYLVRLEIGEEIVTSLKKLIKQENIRLGTISAIGAVDKARLGLYDVKEQKYFTKDFTGDHEIASLTGNISMMNGEHYLHLHMVISDDQFNAYGGHLDEAYISATCEIFINTFEGEVDRFREESIGLNLLKI